MLSLSLSHRRLAGASLPAKGDVAQRRTFALALTPSRSNARREGSVRATTYGTSSLSSDELARQLQAAAAAGVTVPTDGGSSSTVKPSLSLRPLTTFVNVLVTGGHQHVGKVLWHTVSKGAKDEETLVCSNPHEAFMQDASPWATTLEPVLLPEACREMVYTIQGAPGLGSAIDPSTHLECLLAYVLKKQAADYKKLGGCRGLPKSVACGLLEHSPTVCIYELPPEGPARVDLLIMSVLAQHVALLPVINGVGMKLDAAEACQQLARRLLRSPGTYVKNLKSFEVFGSPNRNVEVLHSRSPVLLHDQALAFKDIVELFMSDPVYDMLDHAWDMYNNFCEKYDKAGKDISALLAAEMEDIACMLPNVKARDDAEKARAAAEEARDAAEEARDDAKKAKMLAAVLWQLGKIRDGVSKPLYGRGGSRTCYFRIDLDHHKELCIGEGFQFPRDEQWLKSNWPSE